jgi:hypothetical protein
MALTKLTTDLIDGSLGTDWQATPKTANFTAVAGEGYFVNTTSAAITVTLPSSPSTGDEVSIIDYGLNASTNNITITSSDNIQGATNDLVLSTNKVSKTLVYSDATKGWLVANDGAGGTAVVVPYDISYLVVGGGGGAGGRRDTGSAGGGAGGLLTSTISSIPIGETLTLTVGGGGAAGYGNTTQRDGSPGSSSSITSTAITDIIASGGGYGSGYGSSGSLDGGAGASGGGGSYGGAGGAGTPGQGNDGGDGNAGTCQGAGGGGGAGGAGSDGTASIGGDGGIGATTTIISTANATTSSVGEVSGSNLYFAGGGAGGLYPGGGCSTNASGGLGGGADATFNQDGINADNNTGGGGGGTGNVPGVLGYGGAGGSGVCILRMPTASYSGTTTGTPDVYTEGSDTVLVYKTGGTYTT